MLKPEAPRILLAIITGGRPALADRCSRDHAKTLIDAGTVSEVEWVIREDHVASYESDEFPMNVYPLDWADDYARAHWRHQMAEFKPGGFHGAFTGREWAMRSGAERGYDLVLQMDDNVQHLGPINSVRKTSSPQEMVSLMAEIAMSTNASMIGFQLNSTTPTPVMQVVRPGYPYSFFLEKVGPGRLPYYGPFEDDVMHALEYATKGGPNRTSAVMEIFRYKKVSGGASGMRKHYDASRGLYLAKHYPKNVRIGIGSQTSSPASRATLRGPRHFLNTRGFTPIRVYDRERFDAADRQCREIVERTRVAYLEINRLKILKRSLVPEK